MQPQSQQFQHPFYIFGRSPAQQPQQVQQQQYQQPQQVPQQQRQQQQQQQQQQQPGISIISWAMARHNMMQDFLSLLNSESEIDFV
ncbi:hypothetical protein CLOM_g9543 [Closterium sp. NIES-68]|nr:hypothetical protein CLOM_g9543 [Closterium sp. NIES-68]